MNTQSSQWERYSKPSATISSHSGFDVYDLMDRALKYVSAGVCVCALISGAVLATADPDLVLYAQVTLCTAGLLFFGLAIGAERISTFCLCAATALALPALACLSRFQGVEWLIVAAGLVALWIAAAILQPDRAIRP
jgi:hypothetical protein